MTEYRIRTVLSNLVSSDDCELGYTYLGLTFASTALIYMQSFLIMKNVLGP